MYVHMDGWIEMDRGGDKDDFYAYWDWNCRRDFISKKGGSDKIGEKNFKLLRGWIHLNKGMQSDD